MVIGREEAQLFCCTGVDPQLSRKRSTQVSELEGLDNYSMYGCRNVRDTKDIRESEE